ncbi:thermonuclease family protein [Oscillatoria salina]|uniref:thermonuclease family protein n=1 Tax=Oscillatoria salina TaxID=331517 RepID=UPI0013BB13C8|nr:thermonuclease family protein [Oscillatoria salina]MBZ8182327.1 thermonuclease family protein [Oscillatoria salina IIICB1]NET89978.1 thermonuclease family protein [Kamptonema sp. SIO1D9]
MKINVKLIAVILVGFNLVGCQLLLDIFGVGSYTVKRVADGDTMTVVDSSGNEVKVRFACVDAPEIPHTVAEKKSRKLVNKSQFSWGLLAKERVENLVEKAKNRVVLTITDTDQYGRQISEVRLPDGTFIQEVLVREGLAEVYRDYLQNCPSLEIVEAAEVAAKQSKKGLWGDSRYVSPWEFRRLQK